MYPSDGTCAKLLPNGLISIFDALIEQTNYRYKRRTIDSKHTQKELEMNKTHFALRAITLFAFTLAISMVANAQATRTWVSGVGDDVNPCSRTAPCKTFAGAISKTAVGGEINCLDPGGFGTVTITKSITIDCGGTFGSILASGVNGVNVNDSATATPNTIKVILRNLAINGAGTTAGTVGVNYASGAQVHLDNVRIFGFTTGSAQGVRMTSSGAGGNKLFINDSNDGGAAAPALNPM